MYMDGFNWLGSVCVIFLFPSWVLSTPGKLAGACIGTIILCILLELLIHGRRQYIGGTMSAGYKRLVASALSYGLQVTIGYFIMLIIMTYSGPLFVSVVVGLIGGHVLFNAQDAVFGAKTTNDTTKSSKDTDSEEGNVNIPEGATPCCLYSPAYTQAADAVD